MLRRTRKALFAAVIAASSVAALPPRAYAADQSTDLAAATALFDEAIKLMDKGKYAEACPKLARSNELAPSGGTFLALGECYERIGRTASAWLAFREAAARAASAGKKDAENAALARADRIASRLSRVTIRVNDEAKMQNVEVRRDGVVVKAAEIGTPVPLDPGTHLVEATAPGHRKWSARVALAATGDLEVTVPPLELAPPTNEPTARPQRDTTADTHANVNASRGSTQRLVGALLAGAGLAALGTGAVFGLVAGSTNHDALSHCNTSLDPPRCDAEGLSLTDEAKSQALVSTILTITGAALTVGGVAVWLTAPTSPRGGAGVALNARW